MFERYTEKARRAIFFARYEASQFGDDMIRDTHLLLGLLRQNKAVFARVLPAEGNASSTEVQGRIDDLRHRVEAAIGPAHPAGSTKTDLPLSNPAKRILAYAAEEAERMSHRHIGSEHLLLGILREIGCLGASVLESVGVELAPAREAIAEADFTDEMAAGPVGRLVATSAGATGALEFVCEGKVISSVVSFAGALVPRAGERVVLKSKQGMENSYRVEDLRYVYENFPPDMAIALHRLAKVIVQLKPE
jgi:hypothetical protein